MYKKSASGSPLGQSGLNKSQSPAHRLSEFAESNRASLGLAESSLGPTTAAEKPFSATVSRGCSRVGQLAEKIFDKNVILL